MAKHYFELDDWVVSQYLFASKLALRKGDLADAVRLANNALAAVKPATHRILILPAVIQTFVAADLVSAARQCLGEYADTLYTQPQSNRSKKERK